MASAAHASSSHGLTRRDDTWFFVVGAVGLCALFAALCQGLLADGLTTRGQLAVFAGFFGLGPLLIGTALATLSRRAASRRKIAERALWLAGMVVLPLVLAWSLVGVDLAVYYGDAAPYSRARFVGGLAVGGAVVLAVAIATWLSRRWAPSSTLARIATFAAGAVAVVVAVSLFDVNVFADSLSYAPYTGPALLVLHGGVPLRDAFSQYGLDFVVFVPLLTVLPYSFFTAAAFVSLINVVYYLVFLLLAARVAKHRSVVFIAATLVLLFIQAAYQYNITRTPSVLGMRFLPPLVLVACLAYLRPGAAFSVPSVLALVLVALWSVEALCFGAAAYTAYLCVSAVWQRERIVDLARRLGVLVGCVLAPHAALTAAYVLLFGGPPQYLTYLQLVVGATSDPSTNWTGVADPGLHTWALFGLGYGLSLAYVVFRALQRPAVDAQVVARSAVVAAVCMVGIGEFAYYVARSTTPLLAFVAWPLGLLALWALDWSLGTRARMPSPVQLLVLAVWALLVPSMLGVFNDRFFRPIDPAAYSNSTLLRTALDSPRDAMNLPAQIWRRMQRTDNFPQDGIIYSYPYVQATLAFGLYQRWQREDPEPLVIMPESATLLFYARKPSRLGLAHPPVDGLSATLSNRALQRLDSVHTGDVVLVGNPASWTQDVPLDRAVLARLQERCQLAELDRASDYPGLTPEVRERVTVTAYRLSCGTLTR